MARSSTLGRFAKISMGVALGSLAAFVILTWLALEAGGVAIVETVSPDGSTRSTHVWFATPDQADAQSEGELWVEAGTPGNGWYRDIQTRPTLSFSANSEAHASGRYRAQPILGEAPHLKIRMLLREKYGLRDGWIAAIFDTSHSVAVRLIPISSEVAPNPAARPKPAAPSN